MEDLVKENKLSTEYSKLIASAKIDFEGNKNLSQMGPLCSPGQGHEKRAHEAMLL